MIPLNRNILLLSFLVLLGELLIITHYHLSIADWIKHSIWVALLPFAQALLKQLLTMKLVKFIKACLIILGHLSKLGLLKIFKTLGLRYGVFFLQNRWRFVRVMKVVFLRRGKQFFKRLSRFWKRYTCWQQSVVLVAFLPLVICLFLLGLSFTVTRKTMVHKTQEAAMIKIASSASTKSHGISRRLQKVDQQVLEGIKKVITKEDKH